MMSNTKQQIEETLLLCLANHSNEFLNPGFIPGMSHEELGDVLSRIMNSRLPERIEALIDRLITEARLEEVERIAKYAGAWMNPSSGERTVNWVNMEVINSRIAELQSQLTKKDTK